MRKVGRPAAAESETNRSELLKKSAFDLLSRSGNSQVTIKDIGRESGMTAAMIYYYYKNKEDLLAAAIEYAIDSALERFNELSRNNDHPAALIHEWLRMHVEQVEQLSNMMRLNLDYKLAGTSTQTVDDAIDRFYTYEQSILTNCVRRGVETGIFKDADPVEISDMISTYLDGAMVRVRIVPGFDVRKSIQFFEKRLWSALNYQPAK